MQEFAGMSKERLPDKQKCYVINSDVTMMRKTQAWNFHAGFQRVKHRLVLKYTYVHVSHCSQHIQASLVF